MADEAVQEADKPTPIPPEAWQEFEIALRAYASAVVTHWRDPEFRYWKWHDSKTLTFTTTAARDATVLAESKHPIRGGAGVEVNVERDDAPPDASDAIRPVILAALGGRERSEIERRVEETRSDVTKAITKHPSLRSYLARLNTGRWLPEADAVKFGLTWEMLAIDKALGGMFEGKGWSLERAREIEVTDEDVKAVVDSLRQPIDYGFEDCYIVALLSGPPIDVNEPLVVWEGEWFDKPCRVEVGYPKDAMCAEVIRERLHGDSHPAHNIRNINSYVSLSFSVPLNEPVVTHTTARDYFTRMIDLLRLLSSADAGVLYLHGGISSHDFGTLSPFMFILNDPSDALTTPSRKVYAAPTAAEAVGASDLEALGRLFERYAIEQPKILGLPVAMDRLRAIYERYAPGDLGRLVDATTALEALFLSDGVKDELKFRLQIRIARLLEKEPQARQGLAERFSEIYDLRSSIVHTGTPSKKLKGRAADLERDAVSLLRRAIAYFIESDFARGKNREDMSRAWRTLVLS